MKTISDLVGKLLTDVILVGNDELIFKLADGSSCKLFHWQDCCESVWVDDIVGDLDNLVGSPILMAEEVSGETPPDPAGSGSITWTFYKFATIKGYVDVRWCGTSNGYYSESVNFEFIP